MSEGYQSIPPHPASPTVVAPAITAPMTVRRLTQPVPWPTCSPPEPRPRRPPVGRSLPSFRVRDHTDPSCGRSHAVQDQEGGHGTTRLDHVRRPGTTAGADTLCSTAAVAHK